MAALLVAICGALWRRRGAAADASRRARRHAGDLRRQSDRRRRRQDADRDRGRAAADRGRRAADASSPAAMAAGLPARCSSSRRTPPCRSATSRCCSRASRRPIVARDRVAGAQLARRRRERHRDGRRLPESVAGQGSLDPGGRWRARHRQRPRDPGRPAARAARAAARPRACAADRRATRPARRRRSRAQARSLPLFHGALEPDARGGRVRCAGQKVLAFAGIGDPEKFFATLAAAGIDAPGHSAALPIIIATASARRDALLDEAEREQARSW